MKEIVEATQMSKGAFYHYFKTKEQIFLEIVESIYSTLINIDYKRFTKDSLRMYYEDYLTHLGRMYDSLLASGIVSTFDLNYYSLVFDAIRYFPDFREKMITATSAELASWKAIVRIARQKGEIKSAMNDTHVAEIFIHTSSGVGMNNMMVGKSSDTAKDLSAIWNGFYASIKA